MLHNIGRVCLVVVFLFFSIVNIVAFNNLKAVQIEMSEIKTEIRQLDSVLENIDLAIGQYSRDDRIKARAYDLGMVVPAVSQIRYLNLPLPANASK